MKHFLLNYVQQAFAARSSITGRVSKNHPLGDDDTGPEAAARYLFRHPRGLRQLQRRLRIEAGRRPLKVENPGRRERRCAEKILKRQCG